MFKTGIATTLIGASTATEWGRRGGFAGYAGLGQLGDINGERSGFGKLGALGAFNGNYGKGLGSSDSVHGLSGYGGKRDLGEGYGDSKGHGYGEIDAIGGIGFGVASDRLGKNFLRKSHQHAGYGGISGLNGIGGVGALGSIEKGVKKDGPVINKYGAEKHYDNAYGDGGIHNGGNDHTVVQTKGYDKIGGSGFSKVVTSSWGSANEHNQGSGYEADHSFDTKKHYGKSYGGHSDGHHGHHGYGKSHQGHGAHGAGNVSSYGYAHKKHGYGGVKGYGGQQSHSYGQNAYGQEAQGYGRVSKGHGHGHGHAARSYGPSARSYGYGAKSQGYGRVAQSHGSGYATKRGGAHGHGPLRSAHGRRY